MDEISDADSISMELNEILELLVNTHCYCEHVMNKILDASANDHVTTDMKKSILPISALINNMVIQLYRFSEIYAKMHKIEEATFPNSELLNALRPLRKRILANEEKIRLWRNTIAHSEKQASNYKPIFELDSDYLGSIKNFILQSRLLVHYILIFFHELPAEKAQVSSTRRQINSKMNVAELDTWWPEIIKMEKDILEEAEEQLCKCGFDSTIIQRAKNAFKK